MVCKTDKTANPYTLKTVDYVVCYTDFVYHNLHTVHTYLVGLQVTRVLTTN